MKTSLLTAALLLTLSLNTYSGTSQETLTASGTFSNNSSACSFAFTGDYNKPMIGTSMFAGYRMVFFDIPTDALQYRASKVELGVNVTCTAGTTFSIFSDMDEPNVTIFDKPYAARLQFLNMKDTAGVSASQVWLSTNHGIIETHANTDTVNYPIIVGLKFDYYNMPERFTFNQNFVLTFGL